MEYRHRHFVVFPLFALLLTLSVVFVDVPVRAELSDPVEYATLSQTSQRFDATDLLRINIDGIEFVLFDGSAHIVRTDDAITVSALTSPVAVLSGEQRMIVPVGMQWSYAVGTPLASFAGGFRDWMEDRTPQLLPQIFIERHLEDAPVSTAQHLTLMEIEERFEDEAFWMIASLHPRYRAMAWVAETPSVSSESVLVRTFVYPLSMMTAQIYSDFSFDRYRLFVHDILADISQAEAVIEHLLQTHISTVSALFDRGYPKRAVLLSQYLTSLVDTVLEPTVAMRNTAQEMRALDQVIIEELPLEEAQEPDEIEEPEEFVEVLLPEQVEAVADRMLSDAGALFTRQTTITASEPNRASIKHIIFGGSSVDREASFTLDVVTGLVSDITVDGQANFPYQPHFEDFVEWLRR